jgi:rare lipoprotein A (peptidoglycan hydrolase)
MLTVKRYFGRSPASRDRPSFRLSTPSLFLPLGKGEVKVGVSSGLTQNKTYISLLIAALTFGCATTSRYAYPSSTETQTPLSSFRQTGMASYYAREFDGRQTASGERFNMKDLTAAHQTLPFNTRVRVTNLSNGLSVVVRINDRGPFKKNRIIDLSYAAAKKIGLIGPGTTEVEIVVVNQ